MKAINPYFNIRLLLISSLIGYGFMYPILSQDSIILDGAAFLSKADTFYSKGEYESFYQYCDSASEYYFRNKALDSFIISSLKPIPYIHWKKEYEKAAKIENMLLEKIWEPAGQADYNALGALYMQKGMTEYFLRDHVSSIKSYETAIDNYTKNCTDSVRRSSCFTRPFTAAKYILHPLNISRLLVAQPMAVKKSLPDDFLNRLKHSLKDAKNVDLLAIMYGQKAEALLRLEDTTSAHDYNNQRYNLKKLTFYERANASIDYGNTLHLTNQSQEALRVLEKIRKEIEQKPHNIINKKLLSQVHLFEAYIFRDLEQNELALQKAQKSLNFSLEVNKSKYHPQLVKNYRLLGGLMDQKEEYKQAQAFYRQAIRCIIPSTQQDKEIRLPDYKDLLPSFFLSQLLKRMGNNYSAQYKKMDQLGLLDSALICFRRMIETEDLLKSLNIYQDSRQHINERRVKYLSVALNACYELFHRNNEGKYIDHALYFMEKSRAQELQLALQQKKSLLDLKLPSVLQSKIKIAWLDWKNYELVLDSLKNVGNIDQSLLKNSNNKLLELEDRYLNLYSSLNESIKIHSPSYYKWLISSTTLPLSVIQATIPPQSAMLDFFEGTENLYVVVVGARNIGIIKISYSQGLKSDLVFLKEFLKTRLPSVEQKSQYKTLALNLYHDIFAVLESWSLEELIFIPSSIFHDFPFEVLLTESIEEDLEGGYRSFPYLWRKYRIRYQHFAKAELDNKPNDSEVKFDYDYIGFAPDYSANTNLLNGNTRGDQRPLLFNQKEVALINNIIAKGNNTQTFTSDLATKKAFLLHAQKAKILHLSMHASSNTKESFFSHLLFQPDSASMKNTIGNISKLYLYEIIPLPFFSDLNILTACETGLGEYIKGEGTLSLGRAFSYAGSKSIIESLWNVSDFGSHEFVPLFMKEIVAGAKKTEALQKARNVYLSDQDNPDILMAPYFWAQYVLYGADVPIMESDSANINNDYFLMFALFILLIVIFFAFRFKIKS